jgi:hypothetical protein
MKTLINMLPSALLLAGCASAPPTPRTPALLEGVVENARWTDWVMDYCDYGQPVRFDDLSERGDCMSVGGELYAITLEFPRPPGGRSISRSLTIAFPGHGIPRNYSRTHHVVLQPSPPDFEAATGIGFIATVRDHYDAKHNCLKEIGLGHADERHCVDKDFHARNRDRCLPVSEWLAHYAAVTYD